VTAVVVPAHNEAATIADVLGAIATANVGPIVTVADACTDDTAAIASSYGAVVVIEAADKASAMSAGLARVSDPLTLFLDADLSGLLPEHVVALATGEPLGGQLVGLTEDNPSTPLPPVSGQRRLPTEFLRRLDLRGNGYRAELLLDAAVGNARLPWRHIVLRGVHNPRRSLSHPAMWPAVLSTGVANAPGLLRYTLRGVNRS
jgi:glycosyltransferase involved in cell wall biosynthesis